MNFATKLMRSRTELMFQVVSLSFTAIRSRRSVVGNQINAPTQKRQGAALSDH
jgi:hypothetical protein